MQDLPGQNEIGLSKLTGRREGPELCTRVNHHYNTAMEKANYRQYQRSCVQWKEKHFHFEIQVKKKIGLDKMHWKSILSTVSSSLKRAKKILGHP